MSGSSGNQLVLYSLESWCFSRLSSQETSGLSGKQNCFPRDLTLSVYYYRVVTWYMGSGLKAQNMTGIRAQGKGLRAQKNGIRDHKAFEAESGIRFITRSTNLLLITIFFLHNKVCVHRISWPRYITHSCFQLAAVPVIWSPGCLMKTLYHILNFLKLLRAP